MRADLSYCFIRNHISIDINYLLQIFKNKLTFFAAAKVSSSFPPPDLPEIAFAGVFSFFYFIDVIQLIFFFNSLFEYFTSDVIYEFIILSVFRKFTV